LEDIYWIADVRADMFKETDLELLHQLKASGCLDLGYSLESGNQEILNHMNKKITPTDFIHQRQVLEQAGIRTNTSIVLGYPEETKESIQDTFNVLAEARIYPSAGYLLPQPGTPMYDYAKEKGIIKDEEEYLLNMGDRQDFRVNLTSMSEQEFVAEVENQLDILATKLNIKLEKSKLIKTGAEIQQ